MLELHKIRRGISLSLALTFSAALAGAFFHRATEVHGYCSEHGEQIHLEHHAHEHSGPAGSELSSAPKHSQGAHDCSILLFLAQGQETARAVSLPVQASADTALAHGRHLAAPASISLLSLSPKNSPPRRGS